MSLWRLVKRSLCFYWRTNLGVFLAAAVSTAILTGALLVGDSVHHSLGRLVRVRLGATELALGGQNRFFRAKLADELAAELNTKVAPVLQLRGLISNSNGTRRVNRIEVLGVDERFYRLAEGSSPFGDDWSEGVILNEPLAARLRAKVGDEVVLRVNKPGLMPRDVPLTPASDLSVGSRMMVKAVAGQTEFGRFSLRADQVAPLNVFVPLEWLQEKVSHSAHANMLLVAAIAKDDITVEKANAAIRKCWRLSDVGLELRQLKRQGAIELRSRRIFIDESLAQAAMEASDDAVGVLTYFVNELRLGDRATPYSFVTALGRSQDGDSLIPPDMRDDEILINQWLADDLGAKRGDTLSLNYFVLGPMRRLQQRTSSFRVRDVLALDEAGDAELMPDFPGLAEVKNCRDWEPGIPIELEKIRKRDEEYWHRYRGTPKAFVTLRSGQTMWSNRYGNLTAVRYPSSGESKESIAEKLLDAANPASVGLYFEAVRARGERAGDEATDFGGLFLGFSLFLIAAALVSMGLLFVFGVEKRSEQAGMLVAVGFSQKLIRRLFLLEGGVLAVLGAAAGAAAGLLYTKAMIYGLATVWQDAVVDSVIHFHAKPATIFAGALEGVAVSLIAIWLTLRKQLRRPARELLGGVRWQFFMDRRISKGGVGLWVAAAAIVGAAVLLWVMGTGESSTVATAFFGAGALLLIAELGVTGALLQVVAGRWSRPVRSLGGLGLRNSTRRSGRSLAVVGLLAAGSFLVIAVGANRGDRLAEAQRRDSGTGGFALFGESAIGVLHDLNSNSGRKSLGLDGNTLEGVKMVQLRVHDGDDASCFNLNRAQKPRLLGVEPEQLGERKAFGFIETIEGTEKKDGWALLRREWGDDVVPAIGDYATIVWALDKNVGDELEYSDERGRKFRLRLVGMLKNSIIQGSLVISADEFAKRFPSEDGYRMFLVDAAEEKTEEVMDRLSAGLRDFGLELTPSRQRLAEFNAVENTYLSIFQLLGGLGLILGSVGLGLVVLRNVLDRRGELAMMQAVGVGKERLKQMVLYEHAGLMLLGLLCGVVAALVAVGPALRAGGPEVPYVSLMVTVAGIAISGIVWIWIATVFALGGRPLDALRNE